MHRTLGELKVTYGFSRKGRREHLKNWGRRMGLAAKVGKKFRCIRFYVIPMTVSRHGRLLLLR